MQLLLTLEDSCDSDHEGCCRHDCSIITADEILFNVYVFERKTWANCGVFFVPMVADKNILLSPAVSGPVSLRHFLLQEFLGGLCM